MKDKTIDITINERELCLQDGDKVNTEQHDCGRCENIHTEMTVERDGKKIARLGDWFTTAKQEDELYGGVIIGNNGKPLPNPHWQIHIISNDMRLAMTADKRDYVGLCGLILDHSEKFKHDKIIFRPSETLISKDKERICSECLSVYQHQKEQEK
jgi:hypothetical protein